VHLAQHEGKLAQKGMKQRCASRAQKGMHKEQVRVRFGWFACA
jgi:hypothetical protein